jgi:hypothetical protein
LLQLKAERKKIRHYREECKKELYQKPKKHVTLQQRHKVRLVLSGSHDKEENNVKKKKKIIFVKEG